MSKLYRETSMMHPECQTAFRNLALKLQDDYKQGVTYTDFRIFETYRSPERQEECLANKTSKVGPWKSAHNWGFAADFVAFNDNKWSWDNNHDYKHLGMRAAEYGLLQPFEDWDPYHIESPLWAQARRDIKS